MTGKQTDREKIILKRMAEEDGIREKTDNSGNRWSKVYFGCGAHFQSWLSQVIELKGEANVEVEEADSHGFQCYEESGEKMYRIWIRDTEPERSNNQVSE